MEVARSQSRLIRHPLLHGLTDSLRNICANMSRHKEAAVFFEGPLAVHEEAEAFFEGEVVETGVLDLFFQSFGHAEEFQSVEFVEGLFVEHGFLSFPPLR